MKTLLKFVLVFCIQNTMAQAPFFQKMNDLSEDFYQIQSEAREYFLNNPDSSSDGDFVRYKRWEMFWESRVAFDSVRGKYNHLKALNEMQKLTQNGLCQNSTGAENWQLIGPISQPLKPITNLPEGQNMGLVPAIWVDPNDENIILAGSHNGGLFKTTNGASPNPEWSCITDNSNLPAMGITSIAVEPGNTNVIYIATGNISVWGNFDGYGLGVYKSIDGGLNWTQSLPLNLTDYTLISKVIFHPSDHNTLYAVTKDEVYKTVDGGTNWLPLDFTGSTNAFLRYIEFQPGNPDNIIISGNEIWRYENNGNVWTNITGYLQFTNNNSNNYRIFITTTQDKIYVLYLAIGGWKIQNSADGGNTWSPAINSSDIDIKNAPYSFIVSNENPQIMYVGNSQKIAQKSTSGGSSFFAITTYNNTINNTYTHADIRDMILYSTSSNGTSDKLFIANDGGVMRSDNGGQNWNNLNGTGLAITTFWDIACSENNAELIVGGAQDNDIFTYFNGNWYNKTNGGIGDGYGCVIDNNNPPYALAQIGGSLRKTADFQNNWTGISTTPFTVLEGCFPMVPYPAGNIYVGYYNVWSTQLSNINWQSHSNFTITPSPLKIRGLVVSPENPDLIYVSFDKLFDGGGGIILRSADGGNIWYDISQNLPTSWLLNNDITIDAKNPDRIWVCNGGFGNEISPGIYNNRVFYSSDGGTTWTDYSYGLPQFPVNSIVHDDGGGGLYAATDVGVFYTDDNIYPTQGWICFSNDLPVAVVKDLEINYCSGKLRAATYGRGLWESPLMPATITTSTQWSSGRTLPSDLTISSGATLTISGSSTVINVTKEKKIIVEPGATLIVDGAKITSNNTCNSNMWGGIEVRGNRNRSQYLTGGIQYQGKVILKNNATIENAKEGITTIKTDQYGAMDWNFTGGIIQANNSNFINCRRAVQYLNYHNFHPVTGAQINNVGYFINCRFKTTGQLIDNTILPDVFVSLYEVEGIRFQGNLFKNEALPNQNSGKKGNGIISIDASFNVNSYCSANVLPCPAQNIVKNIFENLEYGIKASAGIMSLKTFTVNNTEFINNNKGISATAVNYPTITNNNFNVSGAFKSYGVYLDNSTGFKLENNYFTTFNQGYVGSYIFNSKYFANAVYNNYYENLRSAIVADLDNFDEINGVGLKINCDDFLSGNLYDIVVHSTNYENIDPIQGENISQSPMFLVRNYYSAICTNENQYYVDSSPYEIEHWNSIEPWAEPVCKDNNVITNDISVFRNRPYDCPGTLENDYQYISAQIPLLKNQIKQLTDLIIAGADYNLINAIISNMSPGNLKNILEQKSPYLSDEVLKPYFGKTSIPHGHIKEIHDKNKPVTKDVWNVILTRNLPAGIMKVIEENQAINQISDRKRTESYIKILKHEKDLLINDKIRLFLNDTLVASPLDSIIQIFKEENRLNAKPFLADAYLLKGDYIKAKEIINSMRADGNMDDICDFKELSIILKQTLECCYKIKTDSALKSRIEDYANDCGIKICKNAQALLQLVFDYRFDEEFYLPEHALEPRKTHQESDRQSKNNVVTKIYPNPANNEINFELNLRNDELINSYITINSLLGIEYCRADITGNDIPLKVNTEKLCYGLYVYSVYLNGCTKEKGTFIIKK